MSDNEISIRVTSKNDASKGFDSVTKSSKDMASGLDRAGEAADGAEGKAQGFSDTLTGTSDIMSGAGQIASGDLFGGLVTAGMGVADLAGGMASFLIPALQNMSIKTVAAKAQSIAASVATKIWAAGQWVLNAALSANPIGLVIVAIVALVAIVVIAYKKSETFRNILNGLWGVVKGVGGSLANLGQVLVGGVMAGFSAVLNGIKSLPGKIAALGGLFRNAGGALIGAFVNGMKNAGGIVSGIAGNVWNAVRGLLNGAIDRINAALEFRISLPLGKSISINPPNIPHLAHGGIAGGLVEVGEAGRELVRLPYGSQVIPNGSTEAMLARGGGGGGGQPIILQVILDNKVIAEGQRKLYRTTNGQLGVA